jgi:hypothetical protein
LLAVAPFAAAASNPVGNWVFVAKPPGGGQVDGSILIKQADGKLSGAMRLAGGEEIPLVELKFEGATLSFKFDLGGNSYAVEVKIDGDKLSGKYTSPVESGTVEGARKP